MSRGPKGAKRTGVIDRLWEIGDIVALVEATDAQPGKRGPHKRSDAEISN